MALSKKIRFQVLQRDNYTCQYCGQTPPKVVLEVDHIISRKDGGTDDILNLMAACFDCNRGKSKKSSLPPNKIKGARSFSAEELDEREEQIKKFYNFLQKKDLLLDRTLQKAWKKYSNNEYSLSNIGISRLRTMVNMYSIEMVLEAMSIAWSRTKIETEEKIRYMGGICKNLKRDLDRPRR